MKKGGGGEREEKGRKGGEKRVGKREEKGWRKREEKKGRYTPKAFMNVNPSEAYVPSCSNTLPHQLQPTLGDPALEALLPGPLGIQQLPCSVIPKLSMKNTLLSCNGNRFILCFLQIFLWFATGSHPETSRVAILLEAQALHGCIIGHP